MKIIFKYSFLAVLFFQNTTIFSQKAWTLEDCIGYALQNNIQIKRQGLQADVAKNNLVQSKIDFLPNLSVSEYHNIGSGPNAQIYQVSKQTFSNGQASIQSYVSLFSGMQKINTVNMNNYNYLSSIQNLEKAKNDITLNIAAAYLQILYSMELLDVAKSQLDITKLQVEKTQKLYDVGNEAKGTLLQIEAQSAAEESNVTTANNNLKLSYVTLLQILDLDTLKDFTINIPTELNIPEQFADDPDSIYRIAVNNLPQIKTYEYQLKSSQSQLSIAKGGRYPQLGLTAAYGSNYDFKNTDILGSVGSQLGNNSYKQISFNLYIPIFTKYQIQKSISNAKIGVQDNEYALRQAQIQLRKEVEQAYTDALAAFENYKSRKKEVEANELSFKYMQEKFDVGIVNSVDYNVEKNNLVKAKSDYLQSKYQFIFKTKILEFYKGNPIKL
jgi:outer membrane protein